jgi:putative FmdB family regulatory protein
MPLYEFQCTECGKKTEVLQRFEDAPLAVCPACGGAVKKLVSSPAFQFKGSGWYVTDYARKGGADAGRESGGADGSTGSDGSAAGESSATKPGAPAAGGDGADRGGAAEGASKSAKSAAASESKSEAGSSSKSEAKPAAKPAPAGSGSNS